MTVAYLERGQLTTPVPIGERWLLVFGGVTRQGNRRARRACDRALEAGVDVVWFDGFEERDPTSSRRVPLDREGGEARLTIVGFADADLESLSGRLRTGVGLKNSPATRWLWTAVTRRLGNILWPRSAWRAVRGDVQALANLASPEAIVFGDDYAVTSAWHAGKIWPEPPIGTEYRPTAP